MFPALAKWEVKRDLEHRQNRIPSIMDNQGRKVIVCDNGTGVSNCCILIRHLSDFSAFKIGIDPDSNPEEMTFYKSSTS